MKRREVFSYEDRFDLVLSYVYEHLDQPLDLIRLAEVAGMSARHWHRIFSAAFGESLPALVKRVRLQRAVALLADNVPSLRWPRNAATRTCRRSLGPSGPR